MNRKVLSVVVLFLLALAIGLPLAGLERFDGDITAQVLGLVSLAVAAGAVVWSYRPKAFEPYVAAAAMVFVVLTMFAGVGYLATGGLTIHEITPTTAVSVAEAAE